MPIRNSSLLHTPQKISINPNQLKVTSPYISTTLLNSLYQYC
jgi:hypothetical protein